MDGYIQSLSGDTDCA